MISQSPNLISWFFIFSLLGAFWYVVDKRLGAKLYRWWYDLTHEHPLTRSDLPGFIFGQKAGIKLSAAIAISVLQSAMSVMGGRASLLEEFITVLVEVPALMVGFYLGPKADKLWAKKDRMLKKVDEFESGTASVSGELLEVSQKAVTAVKEVISELGGEGTEEDRPDAAVSQNKRQEEGAVPEPSGAGSQDPKPGIEEAELDPRKMIDRYLKREE